MGEGGGGIGIEKSEKSLGFLRQDSIKACCDACSASQNQMSPASSIRRLSLWESSSARTSKGAIRMEIYIGLI